MASTVLITGASQGIGQATVHLFAKQGYDLVLASRRADRLQAVAQELKDLNVSVLALPTDVQDFSQVEALIEAALAQFGAIDVLVNNAGIYVSGPVEEFSLADWHQVIDTNLWGYIHTVHALLPRLLAQGKGTIVNVASIGGKVPIPYLTPYVTSKFAVAGFTQALQAELAAKGIQVCGIYPNLIRSSFLERAIFEGKTPEDTQARRQQVEQIVKLPLVEKPEDVANAIWQAVKHQRSEVLVGSANLAASAHGLFPSAMQWIFRKTFQHQDRP
ncbi:MAG: SDR family NAD(P)-dependent oxidoreductase [Elainella sp.]